MRNIREFCIAAASTAFIFVAGSSAALATIEASMCVNYNDPDELVITTDGDPGHKVKIMKSGDTLSKDKFKGATKDLGFTGSSHTISPWSASGPWKPGTYSFEGKDADGVEMKTTATLSTCVSNVPEIVSLDGLHPVVIVDKINDCIPGDTDNELLWRQLSDPTCGDIDYYLVTVECEGSPDFREKVETDGPELGAGEINEYGVTIPKKFWGDAPAKACTVKLSAVMENCNSIMAKPPKPLEFITCEAPFYERDPEGSIRFSR
jgi:hypothetical protein